MTFILCAYFKVDLTLIGSRQQEEINGILLPPAENEVKLLNRCLATWEDSFSSILKTQEGERLSVVSGVKRFLGK